MVLPWIILLLLWIPSPSDSGLVHFEMVDMTYTFDETTLRFPNQKKFELNVIKNGTTEDGYWLQLDEYSSGIHVGTHMDSPCHFAVGKWCTDEIPLERLMAPAAVIDITDKASNDPDAAIEIEDLQKWETLSGRSLDKTIVVMRSGWGKKWGNLADYIGTPDNDPSKMHFPGMSPEAAQWLVDNRHIFGFASDSLTLSQGISKDFMPHRILLGANIYGLENVANVEKIPIVGAVLHVMPMKIGKASGAPTRIVAAYPKVITKPEEE